MSGEAVWDGIERRQAAMVVVVGDVDASNEILRRFLLDRGYRCAVATDDDSMVGQLEAGLPRVVVLDATSGGIGDNLRLLESIRLHDDPRIATTRVIVVARSAANRAFAFQSGADDFLERPFHGADLLAVLEASLRRSPDARIAHRREQLQAG